MTKAAPGCVEDLLAYVVAHPERTAIATTGDRPIHFASEELRYLGRAADFVLAAEAAWQIARGHLNPAERVPVDALAGLGFAAGRSCLKTLAARGAICDGATSLGDAQSLIWDHGDTAPRDWLLLRLGREALEAATARLGLAPEAAPIPAVGEALAFFNRAELRGPTSPGRPALIAEAWRLGDLLRRNPPAVSVERHVMLTNAVSPRDYAAFNQSVGSRGTAASLARAVQCAAAEMRLPPALPLPLALFDSLQAVALFPDASPRVAVVLIDAMPRESWLQAGNSGAHVQLARRLVEESAFVERARARLQRTESGPQTRAPRS